MDRVEWMIEELKRIRGVTELPKELQEEIRRDSWASIVNYMTTEEMDREEERVIDELNEKLSKEEDEEIEDLTIYREEELTEEEIDELPAGALVRRLDESLDMKYLDMWAPFRPPLKKPEEPLTKYGRMRLDYLKNHRPVIYNTLAATGKLQAHLLEIEQTAQDRLDRMMTEMKQTAGVTEKLKAENQMEWVGRMNALKAQAEEILLDELIYN